MGIRGFVSSLLQSGNGKTGRQTGKKKFGPRNWIGLGGATGLGNPTMDPTCTWWVCCWGTVNGYVLKKVIEKVLIVARNEVLERMLSGSSCPITCQLNGLTSKVLGRAGIGQTKEVAGGPESQQTGTSRP